MSDWITLPRLFLVAAPLAMLMAASALAAGERRARARRTRDALGRPMTRVEEGAAGARVLLEGQLDVAFGPCPRFEDGAPSAAATVEASGIGAVPDGLRPHFEDGKAPFLARSARASELALTVGSERVALTGPLDVLIGSHEMDPGAPFGSLAPAVRERVAEVAGADALPAPGATAPILARPIFRSLRSGVRVRAAGVLVKRSDGESRGYRERARWALSGDEGAPVVLAYDGTPRYGGAITAFARGVRRTSRLRALLLATVILGALGLLGALQHRSRARAADHPGLASAKAEPHPHLADPVECAALKSSHDDALSRLVQCTADADCAVEARGGAFFELEGCYRFRSRHQPSGELERIEARWTRLGCSTGYETCPPPPLAMCSQGRCAERPPPPLPETWHREDVPGAFSLYLPPAASRTGGLPYDAHGALFQGEGLEIATDFGQWGDAAPEPPGKSAPMKIGGHDVKVWREARKITVLFDDERGCAPPKCPFFAQENRLTLWARCDTEAACGDAWLALQSVRFW